MVTGCRVDNRVYKLRNSDVRTQSRVVECRAGVINKILAEYKANSKYTFTTYYSDRDVCCGSIINGVTEGVM